MVFLFPKSKSLPSLAKTAQLDGIAKRSFICDGMLPVKKHSNSTHLPKLPSQKVQSLRDAYPIQRLRLALPKTIGVSPLKLIQALEQDIERSLREESLSKADRKNSTLQLCSQDIDLHSLCIKLQDLMVFFKDKCSKVDLEDNVFAANGLMTRYLERHYQTLSSSTGANSQPFIRLMNGLIRFGQQVEAVSQQEQATYLALFPPRDESEYQCLQGMYQRVMSVNGSFHVGDSAFRAGTISSVVNNGVAKYMSQHGWYAQSPPENHVHLTNSALAHIGVNTALLKKIDEYYNSGDDAFSADAMFDLQQRFPLIALQCVNEGIRTSQNLAQKATFELTLQAWIQQKCSQESWALIQQHPLTGMLVNDQGEIDITGFLQFAVDTNGDDILDEFQWNWPKIQVAIEQGIARDFSFLEGAAEPNPVWWSRSYGENVADPQIHSILTQMMSSGSPERQHQVIQFLTDLSQPLWKDRSIAVFLRIMASLTTVEPRLESYFEKGEQDVLRRMSSLLDDRFNRYQANPQYQALSAYCVQQNRHLNKHQLVQELVMDRAPLHMIKSALSTSFRFSTLTFPWHEENVMSALVNHDQAEVLVPLLLECSTLFSFSQKKSVAIEACIVGRKITLATHLMSTMNVDSATLFQWSKSKLLATAIQLIKKRAYPSLTLFFSAPKVVQKLSKGAYCLPGYMEQYGVSREMRRFIDSIDWKGKLADEEGRTPLIHAIHHHKHDRVLYWLEKNSAVLMHKDARGFTALHYAAQAGEVETVNCILRHNPDINAQSFSNATALSLAISSGNEPVVLRLLDCGAMNTGCIGHSDPFVVAVRQGLYYSVRRMLEKGFDPGARSTPTADSAFEVAVRHMKVDMLQIMLESGADPNSHNFRGRPALALLGTHPHPGVVDLLVSHGANIDPAIDIEYTGLGLVGRASRLKQYQVFFAQVGRSFQYIHDHPKEGHLLVDSIEQYRNHHNMTVEKMVMLLEHLQDQPWISVNTSYKSDVYHQLVDSYLAHFQNLYPKRLGPIT